MAVPIWPTGLPQRPLKAGYKRSLPNNLIRSSMDTGSDKVRKRGRFRPEDVQAAYILKPAQVTILENFVHNTIAEGAICFDWWHTEKNKYVRARLKGGNGGLFDIQPYRDSICWQVTLNLEIWPDVRV